MIPKKHDAMTPSTPHAVGVGDGDFDMIFLHKKTKHFSIPNVH
jgi:hypothetical protein